MTKLKHHLILALAAVFSVAGVLSLLTSPALAANPISRNSCLTRAQNIIQRTYEDIMELDPGGADPDPVVQTRICFNPCIPNPDEDETVTRTFHMRNIPPTGGPTTDIQVAVTIEYLGGEMA